MNPISIFLTNEDFPNLAQNIGLALLTILIPVAISILESKKEFEELDKHVALDHVARAKEILGYIILIFLPVFFWADSTITFRIIEVFLWAIGLSCVCEILRKSYLWIKGNKFPLRFEYLNKLSEPKDMEEVWKSVWKTKDINSPNEKSFFDIFSSRIDELL